MHGYCILTKNRGIVFFFTVLISILFITQQQISNDAFMGGHETEENLLDTQIMRTLGSRSDDVSLDVTIEDGGGSGKVYDPEDGLIIKGDIVTMDDDLTVIENGRLIIQGEMIVAVLDSDDDVPAELDIGNAITIDTDGYIFPGLNNAHNHVHYNCMPIWAAPGTYTNRYQWSSEESYKWYVTYPNKVLKESRYYNVLGEAMKYAEVKELISGTTALQNSKMASKGYEKMMVRNIEFPNYGGPRAHATVAAVTDFDQDKADGYISNFEKGNYHALFLHISEGVDEKSRAEFDTLRDLGLARKETIVIHGTALGQDELEYMGENDMTMVWSPVSNLILYGGTADVPTALDEGVNVCLGTDWSPSGGKNLLMELKIADQYDNKYFGNVIEDSELVKMVTCNPADSVSWTGYSGRIIEGLFADIAVYSKVDDDPYRSLIDSTEVDVQLVVIGGDPLYGNVEYMEALKPGDHEVIRTPFGFSKAIDVTKDKDGDDNDIFMGDQKLSDMKILLEDCLEFDMEYMEENFRGDWIDDGISFEEYVQKEFSRGTASGRLDPFYHCVDQYFFDAMKNINYGDFEFGVQEKYYKFMIDGTNVDDPGGGNVTPGDDDDDDDVEPGDVPIEDRVEIVEVRAEPGEPEKGDDLEIYTVIRANITLGSVKLYYSVGSLPPGIIVMDELDTADGTTEFRVVIDTSPLPGNSVISYHVFVTGGEGVLGNLTSGESSLTLKNTVNGGGNGNGGNNNDGNEAGGTSPDPNLILVIAVLCVILILCVIVLLVIMRKRKRQKY